MRSITFVLFALQVCTAGAQPAGDGIFRGRPVMFEIQGEYGIVDGDIILGKVVELRPATPDPRPRVARDWLRKDATTMPMGR